MEILLKLVVVAGIMLLAAAATVIAVAVFFELLLLIWSPEISIVRRIIRKFRKPREPCYIVFTENLHPPFTNHEGEQK